MRAQKHSKFPSHTAHIQTYLSFVFHSTSSYKDNLEPDQISGGLSTVTHNRPQNVSALNLIVRFDLWHVLYWLTELNSGFLNCFFVWFVSVLSWAYVLCRTHEIWSSTRWRLGWETRYVCLAFLSCVFSKKHILQNASEAV